MNIIIDHPFCSPKEIEIHKAKYWVVQSLCPIIIVITSLTPLFWLVLTDRVLYNRSCSRHLVNPKINCIFGDKPGRSSGKTSRKYLTTSISLSSSSPWKFPQCISSMNDTFWQCTYVPWYINDICDDSSFISINDERFIVNVWILWNHTRG